GAAEDFSFFAQQAPGLYVFLGITPDGQDPATAAPNHNPAFFVDESALVVGTRAMAMMAVNFLAPEEQPAATAVRPVRAAVASAGLRYLQSGSAWLYSRPGRP